MRKHGKATIAIFGAIFLLGTSAGPLVAKPAPERPYSKPAAKRGQVHVRSAITTPMEDLLASARTLQPEGVLAYGLALVLGRVPATSAMSPAERLQLDEEVRRARDFYMKHEGGRMPQGDLVDSSDFWILIASNLHSHIEMQKKFADENAIERHYLLTDELEALPNRSGLTTRPAFPTTDVAASHACATYAHGGAVIRQTIHRLEGEPPSDTLPKARAVYQQIETEGSFACSTRTFFDEVSAFAEGNLTP